MAEGHAFKCDMCGRVQFAPERHGPPAAPSSWFVLGQAPVDVDLGILWDHWHFCSIDCLGEFVQHSIEQRDAPSSDPAALEDIIKGDSDEQVLSEWAAGNPC